MAFFPTAVANLLAGRVVRFPLLIEFDFASGPMYVWGGYRKMTAGGKLWLPVKGQLSITGIGDAGNDSSEQITVGMSGAVVTEGIAAKVVNANRDEYLNRLLRIWVQPLDEFWQPIDGCFNLVTGIMQMAPLAEVMDDQGVITRSVTMQAENIFFGRSGAPNSYRSDLDQKNRFAGDRGMEFVTSLINAEISEPW